MLSVYVAGLKKNTGKTLLAAGLCATMQSLSYATSYYKPIQTGESFYNDEEYINKMDKYVKTYTTYKLKDISHPLIGMYHEGIKNIDIMKILQDYKQNALRSDCRIIEGNNGVSSPFDENKTEINLIQHFSLPVILVLNPNIDKIDDVIMGISYIHSHNINLIGIVINDYMPESGDVEMKYYPHIIKEFTGVKILGCLPHYSDFLNLSPHVLISDTLNRLNLDDIFNLKIAKLV